MAQPETFELDASKSEKKVWLVKVLSWPLQFTFKAFSLMTSPEHPQQCACCDQPAWINLRSWIISQVPHFVAKKWHAACLESSHGGEKAGVELGRVVIDPTKSSVGSPSRFLQPEDML